MKQNGTPAEYRETVHDEVVIREPLVASTRETMK